MVIGFRLLYLFHNDATRVVLTQPLHHCTILTQPRHHRMTVLRNDPRGLQA
jgi:hypothetical protein